MPDKIYISGDAIIVEDSATGDNIRDAIKGLIYYTPSKLQVDSIVELVVYDRVAEKYSSWHTTDLSNVLILIDGTFQTPTKKQFREFCNRNLGKPNASIDTDFLIEVKKGNVPGHSLNAFVGQNERVQVSFTDLWNGAAIQPPTDNLVYPTVAESWEVVSSDPGDDVVGAGARVIGIQSLAFDGSAQATIFVSLDGITPVAVPGTHYRLNTFTVVDVGTVRGSNMGDITLRVSGGGALRSVILFDETSALASHHTVPLGLTYFWIQTNVFTPKGEDCQLRFLFQESGQGVFFNAGTTPVYQNNYVIPIKSSLMLPERTEFLFQVKSTNPNIFVTTINEFLIVENEYLYSGDYQLNQGNFMVNYTP